MLSSADDWVDLTGDGGLLKKITQSSSQLNTFPPVGSTIRAHYTGYVGVSVAGAVFDSSRDRGSQFTFRLGEHKVIRGWEQGFATMNVGERALLKCRSDYAYGDAGRPPKIAGGATLLFDVELLGWDDHAESSADASSTEAMAHIESNEDDFVVPPPPRAPVPAWRELDPSVVPEDVEAADRLSDGASYIASRGPDAEALLVSWITKASGRPWIARAQVHGAVANDWPRSICLLLDAGSSVNAIDKAGEVLCENGELSGQGINPLVQIDNYPAKPQ